MFKFCNIDENKIVFRKAIIQFYSSYIHIFIDRNLKNYIFLKKLLFKTIIYFLISDVLL